MKLLVGVLHLEVTNEEFVTDVVRVVGLVHQQARQKPVVDHEGHNLVSDVCGRLKALALLSVGGFDRLEETGSFAVVCPERPVGDTG